MKLSSIRDRLRIYLERKGGRCPMCNSNEIVPSMETSPKNEKDNQKLLQEIMCLDCKITWTDYYLVKEPNIMKDFDLIGISLNGVYQGRNT